MYTSSIPGAKSSSVIEKIETTADGKVQVTGVTVPTLTMYLPEKEKANGAAIIICPGGGYGFLAMSLEGYSSAQEFQKMGIAAFVLKYRLPNDNIMENKETGPLQDAQQAIKLIRSQAKKWNIDTAKVGVIGFSAGGHLASTLGTHFDRPVVPNLSSVSLRPNFMMLLYPVISFDQTIAHLGSRTKLIGNSPTAAMINTYSNETQVTPQTPPTFIVHASNDGWVKVDNSLIFYQALLKNKVPVEMHLYTKGGHGFGLNNNSTKDLWIDRCHNWLLASGFIK
ncbi:alpha/beta hydrolase [Pedobacter petrophilus]|uniref:alpha/beta hydrolase n=1 Tax=Pedobacter petrophilus TaxID=1908241 RepID=UPI001FD792DB|nr:alpha/beta hydrolase [Pedobacter petrophilus]